MQYDPSYYVAKGKLVPQTSRDFAGIHEIIRFDDETGALRIAINPDSNFAPMQFKVLKPMEPGAELFAVFAGKDGSYSTGSSFRLRGWDKDTGMVFLFDSTSQKAISTGKCHIYKEEIPPASHP